MNIHSSAQDAQYSPAAGMYRPAWPLLSEVALRMPFDNMGLCPLHALARWTDIPPTCTLRFERSPTTRVLAVRGWGAGWLHAALTDHGLRRLPVMLVDDDDVTTYADALERLDSAQLEFQHSVCVGVAVTPAGFRQLASAPKLPSGVLSIGAAPPTHEPYMIDWHGTAGLRSDYFKALPLGSSVLAHLKCMRVAYATLLTDRDVAMLALAAPALQCLWLHNATHLTDAALYALLGCQRLETLQVSEAPQLTSSGVLVALALLKALAELVISCHGSGAAAAMVADVTRMDPAVAERWRASEQPWQVITWTKHNA
jgi:hypothetical protein